MEGINEEVKRPEIFRKYLSEDLLKKFKQQALERLKEIKANYIQRNPNFDPTKELYFGVVGPKYTQNPSLSDLDLTQIISEDKENVEKNLYRWYTDRWIGIISI